jgi:hypothetical protein
MAFCPATQGIIWALAMGGGEKRPSDIQITESYLKISQKSENVTVLVLGCWTISPNMNHLNLRVLTFDVLQDLMSENSNSLLIMLC